MNLEKYLEASSEALAKHDLQTYKDLIEEWTPIIFNTVSDLTNKVNLLEAHTLEDD